MSDYEVRVLAFPASVPRGVTRQLLTEQAEYGGWELQRLLRYPDGQRRVWLRRKVIKVSRTM